MAIAEAFGLGVPEGVLVKAGVVLVGVAAGVSVARLFRSCCSRSVFWVSASSFWSSLVRDARLASFWSRSAVTAPTAMTMVPSMAAVITAFHAIACLASSLRQDKLPRAGVMRGLLQEVTRRASAVCTSGVRGAPLKRPIVRNECRLNIDHILPPLKRTASFTIFSMLAFC